MARLNLACAEARAAARVTTAVAARPVTDPAPVPEAAPETGADDAPDEPPGDAPDEAPEPAPPVAATPAPRARAARWPLRLVAAALVGAAAFVVLTARSAPTRTVPSVDSCVSWSGEFTRTPCDTPHAGRVVAATAKPEECPSGTSFMRLRDEVLCIDTSR
jgi:hypothetical protein